jgi:[CysO sulfur-carrier protein]-S-L-cysteine hydrolase
MKTGVAVTDARRKDGSREDGNEMTDDEVQDLILPAAIATAMVEHCERERPNEACGLIARSGDAIVEIYPMRNAAASPVRYALEPKEQLMTYRIIEDAGLSLGGVYHSHTRTEAYPSPTDVRMASEDVPYLIVSLASQPASIRAFRILKANWTDETGQIIEVPVVVR